MKAAPWLDEIRRIARERPQACSVEPGVSLSRYSTLRIGGPAEAFVEVMEASALERLVLICQSFGVPMTMVGRGANVLFPDDGLPGVVCRLAGEFSEFHIDGETVRAGAGVLMAKLARSCAAQGLVGLEALAGFPASVGGAVVMNAGCYGTEVSDWLMDVEVLVASAEGALARRMTVEEIQPSYRTTWLKGRKVIVVSARFQLDRGDSVTALQRLDALNRQRWLSLPSGKPNAGSIFRNPEGDFAGRLLEQSEVKGLRVGGAAFSEKHANVIVNLGGASAADVLELIEAAERRVADRFGIELDIELLILGSSV